MTICTRTLDGEPVIAAGLVQQADVVRFQLLGEYIDATGLRLPPGDYQVSCSGDVLRLQGAKEAALKALNLHPVDPEHGSFSLETTIGIDFHWQQQELQTFTGGLRLCVEPSHKITVINDVPLESYILSVICSEMNAASPAQLAKAHAIISRSWLLAQLEPKSMAELPAQISEQSGEISRYYDRTAHTAFDVCADDHCQRYQGTARIRTGVVHDAIFATRGLVMSYDNRVCDARFSKCCGGVTEDFRVAWAKEFVPYLVPVLDGVGELPRPALTDEVALRRFLKEDRPAVYCNCRDEKILSRVLNSYDRDTPDFFRWQVNLSAQQVTDLVRLKTGLELGRILAMEPLERGLSGRLVRLRLVGEKGSMVIGKELEIRRALSPSHLYSSAFIIDAEGPPLRPDSFTLTGGGWGHGVGLCQIGAAVMACQGISYEQILTHYYPGVEISRLYD